MRMSFIPVCRVCCTPILSCTCPDLIVAGVVPGDDTRSRLPEMADPTGAVKTEINSSFHGESNAAAQQ